MTNNGGASKADVLQHTLRLHYQYTVFNYSRNNNLKRKQLHRYVAIPFVFRSKDGGMSTGGQEEREYVRRDHRSRRQFHVEVARRRPSTDIPAAPRG